MLQCIVLLSGKGGSLCDVEAGSRVMVSGGDLVARMPRLTTSSGVSLG